MYNNVINNFFVLLMICFSSNKPSKEANLKYLSNSVNYFLETLEHATDSEKEVLSDYFSKKAAEVGKDTEYFLEFGGKSENDKKIVYDCFGVLCVVGMFNIGKYPARAF